MKDEHMKFRPAKKKETIGTGRIGTIYASYSQLINIFGDPHDCTKKGEWESRDNKVRFEWAFILDSNKNLVFTIYDYKNTLDLNKVTLWSLGGKKENRFVGRFFKINNLMFSFN